MPITSRSVLCSASQALGLLSELILRNKVCPFGLLPKEVVAPGDQGKRWDVACNAFI